MDKNDNLKGKRMEKKKRKIKCKLLKNEMKKFKLKCGSAVPLWSKNRFGTLKFKFSTILLRLNVLNFMFTILQSILNHNF
jgi:hypothetical protein